LAAGLCPKKLAFAWKIMVLPESGGCSPSVPWLVRLCRPLLCVTQGLAVAVLRLKHRNRSSLFLSTDKWPTSRLSPINRWSLKTSNYSYRVITLPMFTPLYCVYRQGEICLTGSGVNCLAIPLKITRKVMSVSWTNSPPFPITRKLHVCVLLLIKLFSLYYPLFTFYIL